MKQRKNETREQFSLRSKQKYRDRRKKAIEYLGSQCVDCGHKTQLEFDHVDRAQKEFSISKIMSSYNWNVILRELDKCVLRCTACHAHKTAVENLQHIDVLEFFADLTSS